MRAHRLQVRRPHVDELRGQSSRIAADQIQAVRLEVGGTHAHEPAHRPAMQDDPVEVERPHERADEAGAGLGPWAKA